MPIGTFNGAPIFSRVFGSIRVIIDEPGQYAFLVGVTHIDEASGLGSTNWHWSERINVK